MFYYKCDLCGQEQDTSKVTKTMSDPTATAYGLPFYTDDPELSKVEHICGDCYSVISEGRDRMQKEALNKINKAMADKARLLLFRRSSEAAEGKDADRWPIADRARFSLAFKLAWLNIQGDPGAERCSAEHKYEYLRLLGERE